MALVLDTGPLFAMYDRRDRAHDACRRLADGTPEELVVPAPVLVEVDYWLGRYGGQSGQLTFWDDLLDGAYRVEDMLRSDYLRARVLMEQYSDADIGFVDAAVLAVVERLREPKLATLDRRHFNLLRPAHVDSLQLLP